MVISGISAVVSVVGMVVSMPIIQDQMMGGATQGMDMKWSTQQIIMLAVLIIALAFLYATIIALVSVFAKTIKEANSFVMPVYMIVLVVGLLTMYTTKDPTMSSYTAGYSYAGSDNGTVWNHPRHYIGCRTCSDRCNCKSI